MSAAVLYFSVEVVRRDHLFTLIHSFLPHLPMPDLVTDSLCVIEKDANGDILTSWYASRQHNITKANIGIFPLSYDVIMSHNKQHIHISHSYII